MAQYQRLVTYFYRYDQGEKGQNIGYGRLERTGEEMRIYMKIADPLDSGQSSYPIYFYYRPKVADAKPVYIEVGQMNMDGGQGEFVRNAPEEEIFQGKCTLEDCLGIIIYKNQDQFYASVLEDQPLNREDFTFPTEESNEQLEPNESIGMEPRRPVEQEPGPVRQEPRPMEQEPGPVRQEPRPMEQEPGPVRQEPQEEMPEFSRPQPEFLENIQRESMRRNQEQIQRQEVKKEQKVEPYNSIEKMLQEKEALPHFQNHDVMRCVRIVPEDIGKLARENWHYGNNSFVLHGYYGYRYLMLGSMVFADGKSAYVIGVPGIYTNKDKYLANIFGFYDFVCVKPSPYKTGEFGYWIGKLK